MRAGKVKGFIMLLNTDTECVYLILTLRHEITLRLNNSLYTRLHLGFENRGEICLELGQILDIFSSSSVQHIDTPLPDK